ncbi:hypothetical protein QUF54_05180 [Candidatus Marithioploca araucensis]|uniref:Uncharacterized protein n=1 Tax=Candidatus Marithioploca araucensis TaxID=70273 RepID=A0ABT7VT40_9GAMM|nr:hypothetical protein [Candidatus Marithioploca araucensis]
MHSQTEFGNDRTIESLGTIERLRWEEGGQNIAHPLSNKNW